MNSLTPLAAVAAVLLLASLSVSAAPAQLNDQVADTLTDVVKDTNGVVNELGDLVSQASVNVGKQVSDATSSAQGSLGDAVSQAQSGGAAAADRGQQNLGKLLGLLGQTVVDLGKGVQQA